MIVGYVSSFKEQITLRQPFNQGRDWFSNNEKPRVCSTLSPPPYHVPPVEIPACPPVKRRRMKYPSSLEGLCFYYVCEVSCLQLISQNKLQKLWEDKSLNRHIIRILQSDKSKNRSSVGRKQCLPQLGYIIYYLF